MRRWRRGSRRAQAQDLWLSVAIGENRKHLDSGLLYARRALNLCPIQGEGYIYLAELTFLEGPSATAKGAYVDQALRVRPHSGEVLLAAGGEAALMGDMPKALQFWKHAFHQGGEPQSRLIELLAGEAPASFFLANFEPDVEGLQLLRRHYRRSERLDDARLIEAPLARRLEELALAETGKIAADHWREAAQIHHDSRDASRACACAPASCPPGPGRCSNCAAIWLRGSWRASSMTRLSNSFAGVSAANLAMKRWADN